MSDTPNTTVTAGGTQGAIAPLAHQQHRVWLLDQLDPGDPAFNVPFALWLRGPLDTAALSRALSDLAQRHEALRTRVVGEDGQPVMVVASAGDPIFGESSAPGEEAAIAQATELARHRFALDRGPLAVARLIAVGPRLHLLVLVVHHIVCDGWSVGVLSRDLGELYAAHAEGRAARLPALRATPSSYARRQQETLSGPRLRAHLDFWSAHLADAPRMLDLPTDAPRSAAVSRAGAIHRFTLDGELTERIRRYARSRRATAFMVLYATFGVLLHRYTGQDKVVVGFPMADRPEPELETMVGYLSNVLPTCVDCSGDPDFAQVLSGVRSTLARAYEYQDVPFADLVTELAVARDLTANPIFQAHFALQSFPGEPARFGGLETATVPLDNRTAKFDLYMSLEWTHDGMRGEVQYHTGLFSPTRIARLAGHYDRLLQAVADSTGDSLSALPLLTKGERDQLLAWSTAPADPDPGFLAPEAFTRQAARQPSAVALIEGDQRITFGELDARAEALARRLRRAGVEPDQAVGIFLPRSARYVTAVLAVLKAGGAILALDPEYPEVRLATMVADSGVRVVVTDAAAAGTVPRGPAVVLKLDDTGDQPGDTADGRPANSLYPDHLMTVVYTSGSSGQPKGVLGTHGNWRTQIAAMRRDYPFGPGEVCCLKTPVSFVDAVWECLDPLLSGVPLVVLDDATVKDPSALVAALARHRVTRLIAVPSLLQMLTDVPGALPDLSLCISSGEALTLALARRLHTRLPGTRLVNLYGATEITADVSRHRVSVDAERIGVGTPVGGARIHLLDTALNPVPEGLPGEVYVGGDVLARGYLGAPGLTAERFVPSPFGDGERLYRTGDVGRHWADGTVELLGRADQQVKVRGHRVEPGEVRQAVLALQDVADCEVLARTDAGDTQLIAYVCPARGPGFDPGQLSRQLRSTLPGYMVPTLVVVPGLPRLPNGKTDLRALAGQGVLNPAPGARFEAPRDAREAAMARIWQNVLGVARVGVHDNFFDLGGDSVRALRVVALANREGFRLGAQDPIRSQTVADLVRSSQPCDAPGAADARAATDADPLSVPEADLGTLARLLARSGGAGDD